MKGYKAQHRLVNYDGDGADDFHRRASGKVPTDAEGKPMKVKSRRMATPREDIQIAKAQYQGRPLVMLPHLLAKFPKGWSP